MTSSFAGPACREVRQLLGVYVVGAIDPAERTVVDEHLRECQACRDELAGLAGLPAMLSRVPVADVERLSLAHGRLPAQAEPSPELLNSLLRRVAARRRSRMWRGAVAVAAAAVLAAAGASVVTHVARPAAHAAALREVARATSPDGDVSAVVDYSQAAWGTVMRVQVSGISPGTTCQFWVIGKNGQSYYAGSWTVAASDGNFKYSGSAPGYGSAQQVWYPASASLQASAVHSFKLTVGSRLQLNIPAS